MCDSLHDELLSGPCGIIGHHQVIGLMLYILICSISPLQHHTSHLLVALTLVMLWRGPANLEQYTHFL